jgi:metal-responsive CopG/Arc/MetJ family transcriptional regulator
MVVRTVSLSLQREVIEKIDRLRGDVTRSKFIQRILESKFRVSKEEKPPESRAERPNPATQRERPNNTVKEDR